MWRTRRRRCRARGQASIDAIFFLLAVFAIVVSFLYSWNILSTSVTSSLEDFRAFRMANTAANVVIFDPNEGASVRDSQGTARDHLISIARIPATVLRTSAIGVWVNNDVLILGTQQSEKDNAWCSTRIAADSVTGALLRVESCYYYNSLKDSA